MYFALFSANIFSQNIFANPDNFPRTTISDPSKPKPSPYFSRAFSWNFKNYTHSVDIKLKTSFYHYYKNLSKTQPYEKYAEERDSFYFVELCKQLDVNAKHMHYQGIDLVNYLTTFVQSVPYKSEVGEYKKYPIETLFERGGDCEDKSALLAAILNTFGFDAAMVLLPGHMAVAISCNNCGGYYLHNGKQYSFIETTANGWTIGSVPEEYLIAKARILDIKHTSYYDHQQETPDKWTYATNEEDLFYNPNEQTKPDKPFFRANQSYGTSPNQESNIIYVSTPSRVIYYQGNNHAIYPPNIYFQQLTQPIYQQSNCNPPIQIRTNGGLWNGGSINIMGKVIVGW